MPHMSYIDIVNAVVAHGEWGRDFADDEAAARAVLASPSLSGYATLALIERFDSVMESVAAPFIEKRIRDVILAARKALEERRAELIKRHGPCPDAVRRWLAEECYRAVGYFFFHWHPENRFRLDWPKPEKGTPLRKEYDLWTRRKVKQPAEESTS